jgi:hypothetical protein
MTKKKVQEEEKQMGLTAFMSVTEIDGFPVKEWTTQQFCQLYPILKHIVEKLMEAGMTLQTFNAEELMKYLPTISDAVIPVMPEIIKISCPTKTAEDFDSLKWPRAIQLVMAILKVNVEHLADFFGLSPE